MDVVNLVLAVGGAGKTWFRWLQVGQKVSLRDDVRPPQFENIVRLIVLACSCAALLNA